MEILSEQLKKCIEQSGKPRPQVAEELGVGTSALAKWLNGNLVPKSHQLFALSQYFEVTMEWLLTGRDPPSMDGGKIESPSADENYWKQRALNAEKQLTELKQALQKTLKKF